MLAYVEWVKVISDVENFLYQLSDYIAVRIVLGSWVWGICDGSIVVCVRSESGFLLSSRAPGSIVSALWGLSCNGEADLWRGVNGYVEVTMMYSDFVW